MNEYTFMWKRSGTCIVAQVGLLVELFISAFFSVSASFTVILKNRLQKFRLSPDRGVRKGGLKRLQQQPAIKTHLNCVTPKKIQK